MLNRKKDFIKLDDFQGFSSLSGNLVRLSIKINYSGFDFHKISLPGIVEARCNISDAMVIWKRLY